MSDAGNSAMEPRPEKDEDGPHPEKGGLVPHPEKDSATSESEDGGKSLNNVRTDKVDVKVLRYSFMRIDITGNKRPKG